MKKNEKILDFLKIEPGYAYNSLDNGLDLLLILKILSNTKNQQNLVIFPVLNHTESAKTLLHAWSIFFNQELHTLLLPESLSGGKQIPDMELVRSKAINAALSELPVTFLASAAGAFSSLPDMKKFQSEKINIKVGDTYDFKTLTATLIDFDYADEYEVNIPGEFSKRGCLFDIFSPAHDYPVRIDFFGDTVETIKIFDPVTQRTIKKIDNYNIISSIPSYFHEELPCVFSDYLVNDHNIFVICPEKCREHIEIFHDDTMLQKWDTFISNNKNNIYFFISPDESFADTYKIPIIQSNIRKTTELIHGSNLKDETDGLFAHLYKQLTIEKLNYWLDLKYKICIFGALPTSQKHIKKWLQSNNFNNNKINIINNSIPFGICIPEKKIVYLSEKELFSSTKHHTPLIIPELQKNLKINNNSLHDDTINDTYFTHLEIGDYAVHLNHGVCLFHGIIEIDEEEMFKLEFDDDVIIYAPVRHANMLSRYIGSKKDLPKLHKIGGTKWLKDKTSAAIDIRQMATDLLKVQALRLANKGYNFPNDDFEQHVFEEAFPFIPTNDQEKASIEIKNDMINPRPMDRLLCGDVGFGKTEVAMRAAFKAVSSGKQVAVLVPTTILAQQHFYSFRDRFVEHPVFIEMLSRFRTSKQQKKILEDIKNGLVDIIIGTHRLLQSDVQFSNLGLVIIDEEQRFGVKHKEILKKIRTTVDILTMTATPIPRTLYMSMTGLRDLSTLTVPPNKRLPVRTFISKPDEKIINEAIMNEISRGGQVFYLHNRVKTIQNRANYLKEMLPDVSFAVAHGRMEEKELEYIMGKFLDGKIDVLVCTTIIESGLDIQNANTIIIERADRFGLSELYQLRGRVGRWHRQAFAYLFIPLEGILSGNARKRIGAIKKFTELGAGFRLALRDLEIRGAGNILGAKQSGHINSIGFELYCQLLNSTVQEYKNGVPLLLPQVDIHIDFMKFASMKKTKSNYIYAAIPQSYIPSETQRTSIYKRFANISSKKELDNITNELKDRFGVIPKTLKNFIIYSHIRLILALNGITNLLIKDQTVLMKKNSNVIKINNAIPTLSEKTSITKFKELYKLLKTSFK
jgi:transcription-repair coupling factor (superfamily II helicase)